ncbi:hypothetical protein V6N13_105657 [Hibiscus sabdariffa]|uniref:Uncharacterized protein n=1 Tax=Hibiscus sabdariffa TaxID=183260 RepID=A0ABR1ZAW6_9ROSI
MRHRQQPLQVQGGWTDGGISGVCRCGHGGVASGGFGLLLQARERSSDHGSSGHGCLPFSDQCNSYMIWQNDKEAAASTAPPREPNDPAPSTSTQKVSSLLC